MGEKSDLGSFFIEQGKIHLALGDWMEAIGIFTEALELYPDLLRARVGIARAFEKLDLHQCIRKFREIIQLSPDSPEAYFAHGSLSDDEEKGISPIEHYSQAIILDPSFAEAFLCRGAHLAYQQRYKEALTDFSHCIEFDPLLLDAYIERAEVLTALGDYDAAKRDLLEYSRRRERVESWFRDLVTNIDELCCRAQSN
jgi:tetratricopeptide (TPR) repeat protein